MTDFEWPDDTTFRRFASKIADAVTVAINDGVKIGENHRRCRCPLGCFTLGTKITHPDPWFVTLPVEQFPAVAFGQGFDGLQLDCDEDIDGDMSAYHALGLAYRRRFVEGVK
jgi:hypothetical protein